VAEETGNLRGFVVWKGSRRGEWEIENSRSGYRVPSAVVLPIPC